MLLENQDNHRASRIRLSDDEVFIGSLRDPNLFGEVVDRYEDAFLRKAREILKDEEDAYDAVQEAFVRMYASAKKYRIQQNASFRAWAYKILVNQCFTAYKKNRKESSRRVLLDEGEIENIPDAQELSIYNQKFTKEDMMIIVSRLPNILYRTVHLYFFEGVPQKEIAEREGVSPGAIRVRLHRAKKELKEIALNI